MDIGLPVANRPSGSSPSFCFRGPCPKHSIILFIIGLTSLTPTVYRVEVVGEDLVALANVAVLHDDLHGVLDGFFIFGSAVLCEVFPQLLFAAVCQTLPCSVSSPCCCISLLQGAKCKAQLLAELGHCLASLSLWLVGLALQLPSVLPLGLLNQ